MIPQSPKIMAHIIPYYPNETLSKVIAEQLVDWGIAYLEVQFPFSDPTADGPVIEGACNKALEEGFTVQKGFDFIKTLRQKKQALKSNSSKIFLMTYASIPYTFGIENFVRKAQEVGVQGLIIPDLPIDSDEGLRQIAEQLEVCVIPVLAINSSEDRIALVEDTKPEYVYCVLRSGTTGAKTELGDTQMQFLKRFSAMNTKTLAGFGIQESAQISTLSGYAHATVIGSAFVRELCKIMETVDQSSPESLSEISRRFQKFLKKIS